MKSIFAVLLMASCLTVAAFENLPSDIIVNEIAAQLVNQSRSPYDLSDAINNFRKSSKANAQTIDASIETIIKLAAIKFEIDPLLAALFLDTPQSNNWFKSTIAALEPQAKSKKIVLILEQLVVYAQNNSLFKQVLKTLCAAGGRLKPLTSVDIDGIAYSFTYADGDTDIIKNQNEQKTVVDTIAAGEPRCLGFIGNTVLGLANKVLFQDFFEINVFYVDLQGKGIIDNKTFEYKASKSNMLDAVYLSRLFVKDRYVLVAAPMKKNKNGEFEIEYDKVSSYSFFIINSNTTKLIERFDVAL